MSDRILYAVIIFGVMIFILSFVSAGLIRWFDHRLTLREGFFIGLAGMGAWKAHHSRAPEVVKRKVADARHDPKACPTTT